MKEQILKEIREHSSKITFREQDHTYFVNKTLKTLTSVSKTLEFYAKGLKYINPLHLENALFKGNTIHAILENWLRIEPITTLSLKQACRENVYWRESWIGPINYARDYIAYMLVNRWKILSVEQLVWDNQDSIAGTIDLLLFKKLSNNKYAIKIVDWKTGNLKTSNYAQVAIYQSLLKKALKGLKKRLKIDLEFTTQLISLKDNEKQYET